MDNNRKILIIENQWAEFEKVAICLTDKNESYREKRKYKYNVLMSSTNSDIFKEEEIDDMQQKFSTLVDKIRIWVNKGYNKTNDSGYRTKAFEEIKNIANKSDLIIMDHILGGAYGCLTGIDIAKELAEGKEYDELKPILFLSKTELTDKEKKEEYDKYITYIKSKIKNQSISDIEKEKLVINHTQWVFKGFFGDEILKEDYIQNEVVMEGVEVLIKKNIREKHMDLLSHFIAKSRNIKNNAERNIHSKLEKMQDEILKGKKLSETSVKYLEGKKDIASLAELNIVELTLEQQ